MSNIDVNFPSLKKLINIAFIPSFHNTDRYLIEWGGRGSSKSVFTAKKLIIRCLTEKYFRYILYRNVFDTIRDSQWQTIKDCVYEMGLQEIFRFTRSPLEINCLNGNKFIARGGDRTEKIKSVKDPTGVWYEEDIPEIDDFYNITGTIRTTKADYLQEIFTLNPEVEGHFEDNWFWKQFFKSHDSEKSFSDVTSVDIEGEIIELKFMVHHSTYHDNRFLPKEYKALLEQYKHTNPYKYIVHTLGLWGVKEISDRFWKYFDIIKHVKKLELNLEMPIHISFDENVRPYPALSIWQVTGKEVMQIHEICLRTPNNKLTKVANALRDYLLNNSWNDFIYIYGDSTSKKDDAKLEKGQNYFTILENEIRKDFKCSVKYSSKNPSVKMSAEFINSIYDHNYDDISITINETCRESINDYMFAEEAQDGTMKKTKKNGIELIGHISDTKRYFLTRIFSISFTKYQRGDLRENNFVIGKKLTDRSF